MRLPALALIPLLIATGGCVRAATDLAALPVRVTRSAVGLPASSQAERDRDLGRAVRRAEARDRRSARDVCRAYPEDCNGY